MIEISLCMIVKNEEETLSRCLSCAAGFADEIIVVDTGSADKTKEIAADFTDKIFDFEWIDDFSAARNYAFSKARCKYIMWLDADDVIDNESISSLLKLKERLESEPYDVIYMPYHISFDEDGKPSFSYYRERIVRRAADPVWTEPIHEVIDVSGSKLYFDDAAVMHKKIRENPKGRNLSIFKKQLEKGTVLSPRLQFYYARELMYNSFYDEAIGVFEDFLNKGEGWFENCISACRDLSYCYERSGQKQKAMDSVVRAFGYDLPRGEILCRIAELFFADGRLDEAEYWYQLALKTEVPKNSLGFIEKDHYDFIPAIQLCVIYDKYGNFSEAERYNELAGSFKPMSSAYLHNRNYFDSKKG